MKTFNQILEEFFKIKADEISDNLMSKDIPEWDSMNYLLFIAAVEQEFNISFSMDEVITAQRIGDLRSIVNKKTKQ